MRSLIIRPTWTPGTAWHEENGDDDVDADNDNDDEDDNDDNDDEDDNDDNIYIYIPRSLYNKSTSRIFDATIITLSR